MNEFLWACVIMNVRWSLIAGRIPGRTDNEIKNYWNTHLKRKLKSMGLDPSARHKLPSFPFSSSGSTDFAQLENRSCDEAKNDCNEQETTNSLYHISSSPSGNSRQFQEIEESNQPVSTIKIRSPAPINTVASSFTENNQFQSLGNSGNFSSEADSDDSLNQMIPDLRHEAAAPPRSTRELTVEVVKAGASGQAAQLHPNSPDSVLSTYNLGSLQQNSSVSQAPWDHNSSSQTNLLQVRGSKPPPPPLGPSNSIPQVIADPLSNCADMMQVEPANHVPVLEQGSVSKCNTPSTCSSDFSTEENNISTSAENSSSSGCDSSIELVHPEFTSGLCRNGLMGYKDSVTGGGNDNDDKNTSEEFVAMLDSAADHQDPYYTLMANLSSLKTMNADQISSMGSSSCSYGYSLPLENLFSPFPEYMQDSIMQHEMQPLFLGDQAFSLQPLHSSSAASFLSTDDNFWESCVLWFHMSLKQQLLSGHHYRLFVLASTWWSHDDQRVIKQDAHISQLVGCGFRV